MSEAVVLVHGIWCNRAIMAPLGRRLRACGFEAYRFGYPSVRRTPADNAAALAQFAAGIQAATVHYVGHSLGGLVILRMFADHGSRRPGRIVLLGTPLAGSRNARKLARYGWGRRLLGLSVREGLLGASHEPWPEDRAVGMVAGSVGIGLGLLLGPLGEQGDGAVTIAETRSPALTAHRVLATTHTGLLFSPAVARETCHFLRTGRFESALEADSRGR